MKIYSNKFIYILCIFIPTLYILFTSGCGTKSSYSVHTVPDDITGTWKGTATRNYFDTELTISFFQTGKTVVIVYYFDETTGTVTGTYESGNLEASTTGFNIRLLFLATSSSGKMTIDDKEYELVLKKKSLN